MVILLQAGMGQTTLNRRNIAIGASAMQYAGILSSSDELESNIVIGNFAGYMTARYKEPDDW